MSFLSVLGGGSIALTVVRLDLALEVLGMVMSLVSEGERFISS